MSSSPIRVELNRHRKRGDPNPELESDSEIDRERPTIDSESSTEGTGVIPELFDVLVATDDLLESIDFKKLPDVVNAEELPTLVDLERLSDALRERDLDLAFDLSQLERVINRRELWNSLDLLGFVTAKRELEDELEDVLDADVSAETEADSEAVSDAREFVSSLNEEGREVMVQQEAAEEMKAVREALIEQHAALERLYASNERRFGSADERRATKNPTAVSLRPPGPIPDSVSTRLSTVPSEVRHSKIDALSRIYGRRWRRHERTDSTE